MTDTNALIAQIIRDNLSGPMFDEPELRAAHQKDIENTAALILSALTPATREDGYSAGVRAALAAIPLQLSVVLAATEYSAGVRYGYAKSRKRILALLDAPALPDARAGAVEPVDPWAIIEKLRIQHRDEIHNVWMPLAEELRKAAYPTATCTETDGHAGAVEPVDDCSLSARIGELGNQLHNMSCEHQNDEHLSERLSELRGIAWSLASEVAAPPTPACTATDGPASACVYRAPGLGTAATFEKG